MGEENNMQAEMAKQGIIDINDLNYSLKPDLSVTTSRTTTTQFFQNQSYAENSTMVCILNTGSSFIYGPNSTLVLDVKITNDGGSPGVINGVKLLAPGSAASLIQRITIMTRSGVVLERIDGSHVLSAIKANFEHSNDWFGSVGQLMGMNSGEYKYGTGSTAVARVLTVGEKYRFEIPMSLLSGLFQYENLLPSALMSGLRIELTLNPGSQCLMAADTTLLTNYGYQVFTPRIMCDSYMLTDSITRSLNESAAASGLEIVFKTYFTTVGSRSNSNVINVESRRACSRAMSAFYIELATRTSVLATNPLNTDVISSTTGPTQSQWRAGSLYFPNSAISGTPEQVSAENYQMALQTFNKYASPINPRITFQLFRGLTDSTGLQDAMNIMSTTFERSTSVDLAGIPLSNSRVLALNATFQDSATTAKTSYLFLEYITLARVFISNCTVEV
jgi:hypothetical protein